MSNYCDLFFLFLLLFFFISEIICICLRYKDSIQL